jgi:hypothetical protein
MVAREVEEEFEKELESGEDESQEDMPLTTGTIISTSLYRFKRQKKKGKSRGNDTNN